MESYNKKISINAKPESIYNAITTKEGLTHWWTNDVEVYSHVGGTATFRFGPRAYVVMKISKLLPMKDVVWKCVEQYFKMNGCDKTDEWVGTTVKFSLQEINTETTSLSFVHEGLNPQLFCFKEYQSDWEYYLNSLKRYVEIGKGTPFKVK